jgi:uncharacterized membrane protein YfcA
MWTVFLALTAFATAVLSGVFGMAGGMLLMGVYTALLPVAAAMVLHGATQLIANGMRAVILWRSIYVRGLLFYVIGSLVAFALVSRLRYVPAPWVVFLGLGLAPFVAALLPARALDFERPGAALLCGAQVATLQLLAGAAGPLLDVAFVQTRLSRTQVVATKAITQVFAHSLKLVYFASFAGGTDQLSAPLLAAILVATLLGTLTGTRILEQLSDQTFRTWSRHLVYGIGAFYLYKAGMAVM